MISEEIRQGFLEFFKGKGHKIVPSSSLIPDDPSVLLTTAGMQQFKKYFIGELDVEKDFGGRRLVSVQKCFRTSDIDEVGKTPRHLTFFEMLGNFSIGDYFKKEAIDFAWELLVKKFNLPKERLWITIFEGDKDAPKDEEARNYWLEKGVPAERIFEFGKSENFWGPTGEIGPCGPCSEIHYDLTQKFCEKAGKCGPNCECGRFIEIWNLVFMQYFKNEKGEYQKLPAPSIDTGMGLERIAMVLQNKSNVFETDIFRIFISKINELAPGLEQRAIRILADHLRASVFLIADGVLPSNKEAGYVLRRLLRRILAYQIKYDIHADLFPEAIEIVKGKFGDIYSEVKESKKILEVLEEEKQKFQEAISKGIKEIEKLTSRNQKINGKNAFYLYETFGLPFELIKELAPKEIVSNLSKEDFNKEFKKHQEISRAGAEKKFGGHGLILDTGELKAGSEEEMRKVIRLHTATHLLHWALREILGKEVQQMGSDINPERTRFDFSFNRKMTPEEIKKVEDLVNQKIKENLPVSFKEMPKEEAEKTGALHFFKQKYPDVVKVYFIGPEDAPVSIEFCGGPHVEHTSEIGKFKISKEESVGAGVRRIRAVID